MVRLNEVCEKAGIPASLAFIGGGNLVMAIVDGLVAADFVFKSDLSISVRSEASLHRWQERGFENVYRSNKELLERHGQGIVFLGVKPQQFNQMLSELTETSFSRTQLVVSLIAGVDLATLTVELGRKGHRGGIVHFSPNTACAIRASASILAVAPETPRPLVDAIITIAEKLGVVTEIDEKLFPAAAALQGSAPAFIFTVIEALADGGVLGGCPRTISQTLATHAVLGAAKLVAESGEHPAVLRDKICSPGGTTIAGIRELEKAGMRSALIEAVNATTEKMKQLSK